MDRRLTDEEKARAADPVNIKNTLILASWFKNKYYWMFDDIESAAMQGLIRAARKFDPTRATSFKTYLAWTVRSEILNVIRDYDRGRMRRCLGVYVGYIDTMIERLSTDDAGAVPAWLTDPAEPADKAESAADEVRAIINKLPDEYQEPMRLYYLYGYSWQEIAIRYRITVGTIYQIHFRAIRYLRANYSRESLSAV